jgi:hypothetical protein
MIASTIGWSPTQVLQRLRVGGVAGLDPAGLRQLELVEQHLLQLRPRADVEGPAGVVVDLAFELVDPGASRSADLVEHVQVDRDPGTLHPGEHRRQRQLDVVVQGALAAPSSSAPRCSASSEVASARIARSSQGSSSSTSRLSWSPSPASSSTTTLRCRCWRASRSSSKVRCSGLSR